MLRVVLLTVLLVLSHSVFADKALVVGSFTDPDNAWALVRSLQKKTALNPQVIPSTGQSSALFRVALPFDGRPVDEMKAIARRNGISGSWPIDWAASST